MKPCFDASKSFVTEHLRCAHRQYFLSGNKAQVQRYATNLLFSPNVAVRVRQEHVTALFRRFVLYFFFLLFAPVFISTARNSADEVCPS